MKDPFKDLPETDLRSGQRKCKICGDLADTGNQCDWCRDCRPTGRHARRLAAAEEEEFRRWFEEQLLLEQQRTGWYARNGSG